MKSEGRKSRSDGKGFSKRSSYGGKKSTGSFSSERKTRDDDRKPYSARPARAGSAPPRRKTRDDAEARPARFSKRPSYADKKPSADFSPRRKFGENDRKPYSARPPGFSSAPPRRKTGEGAEDRPARFSKRPSYGDKKPSGDFSPRRKFGENDRKPYSARPERFGSVQPRRKTGESSEDRPARFSKRPSYGDKNPTGDFSPKRKFGENDRKPYSVRPARFSSAPPRRKAGGESESRSPVFEKNKWNRKENHEFYGERKKPFRKFTPSDRPPFRPRHKEVIAPVIDKEGDNGLIRLNKFIANAGVCSRREADKLIESGAISVNGEIITTLGFKVNPGDIVNYGGQKLNNEQPVYLLLNKPKDYITTVDDPRDRKTVMSLIEDACNERVYPVGRLDRNTTGLLLFTNDGHLADKLTHPSFEVKKVYEVHLDKNLKQDDFEAIAKGINLEDGFIKPDEISYSPVSKSIVGVELHSGRNRIVRRIFEQLSYRVIKLDRVLYAGLTKKDLPRGKYRFLTQIEVANLKMLTGKRKNAYVSSH